VGVSRDCPIFLVPHIISGTGKATNFKFCTHIYRLNRNKSPLKISGKVAMGVVRDSRKFSGHPYIGRIARPSLRWLSFPESEPKDLVIGEVVGSQVMSELQKDFSDGTCSGDRRATRYPVHKTTQRQLEKRGNGVKRCVAGTTTKAIVIIIGTLFLTF